MESAAPAIQSLLARTRAEAPPAENPSSAEITASETKFSANGYEESATVAEREFGAEIEDLTTSPVERLQQLDIRTFLDDHTARVRDDHGRRAIIESSVPLRAKDDEG
jgi:hypothetical protein